MKDPEEERSDELILSEINKSIRQRLQNKNQGVNAILICFKDQKGLYNSFKNTLKILNLFKSLDSRVDLSEHPKFLVFINDITKDSEEA